jgi:hypothetical protein
MFGGMLRRMACRVRPYEKNAGLTDRTLQQGLSTFRQAFFGERDKLAAAIEVVDRFVRIETSERNRFQGFHLRGPFHARQRSDEPGSGALHRTARR